MTGGSEETKIGAENQGSKRECVNKEWERKMMPIGLKYCTNAPSEQKPPAHQAFSPSQHPPGLGTYLVLHNHYDLSLLCDLCRVLYCGNNNGSGLPHMPRVS